MSGFVVKCRGGGLMLREYVCLVHGRYEVLIERPAPETHRCAECGAESYWHISAPAVHTQFAVSVTQGKAEPKPHKNTMDLRPLGEGQKLSEWRKERKKIHEAERHRRVKELLE